MEEKKQKSAKQKQVQKEMQQIWNHSKEEISSDIFGSYTGTPVQDDKLYSNDTPVQDADDL